MDKKTPANQKIPESTYSIKYQVDFDKKLLASQRNKQSKQVEDVSLEMLEMCGKIEALKLRVAIKPLVVVILFSDVDALAAAGFVQIFCFFQGSPPRTYILYLHIYIYINVTNAVSSKTR